MSAHRTVLVGGHIAAALAMAAISARRRLASNTERLSDELHAEADAPTEPVPESRQVRRARERAHRKSQGQNHE